MSYKLLSAILSFTCLLALAACGEEENGEEDNDSAVIASYTSPTIDPAGLTFDGSVLWMSGDDDSGTDYQPMLYRIDPETGALISKITPPVEVSYAGGLAWTGTYLVVLDGVDLHYIDNAGNHVSSFTAPTGVWDDNLAFDGTNFWISNGFDTVHEIDNAGNEISSFIMGGSDWANGLTWDGSHLWVAGAYNSVINKVDTSGNLQGSIDLALDFTWLQDLAYDGTYLWIAEDFDDKLYKLSIE